METSLINNNNNEQQQLDSEVSQRNIDISLFLQSRAGEMDSLQTELKFKIKHTTKLSFQQLPKHMRRRAMSHNRYRVPSRIRAHYDNEMLKSNKFQIANSNKNKPSADKYDIDNGNEKEEGTKQIDKDISASNGNNNKLSRAYCRKHIRKPKLLLCEYQRRSKTCKWLETHLWHSKRMKMAPYFGQKIALHSNDKSARAAFRYANHDCLLYDASYYQILKISFGFNLDESDECKFQHLKQLFAGLFLNGKLVDAFFSTEYVSGNKMFVCDIYKECQQIPKQHKKLIYPRCEMFHIPSLQQVQAVQAKDKRQQPHNIIMLVHPAAVEEIKQEIHSIIAKQFFDNIKNSINVTFSESFTNIFQLHGPKSLQKFNDLLRQVNFDINGNDGKNSSILTQCLPNCNNSINFPKNAIQYFDFDGVIGKTLKQSEKPWINGPHFQDNALQGNLMDSILTSSQQLQFVKLALYKYDQQQFAQSSSDSIFKTECDDAQGILLNQRFRLIQRSQHTHKKKNEQNKKIKKADTYNFIKESIQIESIEEQMSNNFVQQNELANIIKQEQAKKKNFKFMIIFDSDKNFGAGIKVIAPPGEGCLFWRLLVFQGCKAVGLQEYESILQENQQFVYPRDFPQTVAYNVFNKSIEENNIMKYLQRPKAKRINYQSIKSLCPFSSNWDLLKPALLKMLGHGTPNGNSLICLPTADDLHAIEQMDKQYTSVHTEPIAAKSHSSNLKQNEDQQKDQKQMIENLKSQLLKNNQNISRRHIGFVTSGSFSFLQNRGSALGYITAFEIALKKNEEMLVLIRKATSRQYFMAKARAIDKIYF